MLITIKITPAIKGTIAFTVTPVIAYIIALIGIVLARDPQSSVFQIVSFAWAGFGAVFGPAMLCALFWDLCWQ